MATTKYPNGIEGPLTGNVTGNITGNVTGFASGDTPTVLSGDGAITVAPGTIKITKGTAAAITLAAPTTPAQDGIIIEVFSTTAAAHVITCASDGFNAKGSSGTATFGAQIGNYLKLRAEGGHWLALVKTGVTIA